jgi:hypothetical protein
MPIVEKTTELSEEVLESVTTGQQHAIAAWSAVVAPVCQSVDLSCGNRNGST